MKKSLFLVVCCLAANAIFSQNTDLPKLKENRGMFCSTTNGLAKAYWQKANDLFANRDFEGAIVQFKKSINADSSFCDAYHGLSIIYSGLAKPDSAEYYARRAYMLNQDNKLKADFATILGMRGKYEEASALFEALAKAGFQPAMTHQSLAQMYLYLERFEDAIREANASIAICEKDDPWLAGSNYLIIGSAWLWQQNAEKAKPNFLKAMELGINVPETYRKAAGIE